MADIELVRDLLELRRDLVRRADNHVTLIDDRVHFARQRGKFRFVAGALCGGLLDLTLNAAALRFLGRIARRAGETRVDMQTAAVEILGGLAIEAVGFLAALGDSDKWQEAGVVRIAVLAEPVHFGPEPVHRRLSGLVAVIGQVAIDMVHLGAPTPGLDRAAARYPDRRARLLHRTRPDIDIALLVEAAVEREC